MNILSRIFARTPSLRTRVVLATAIGAAIPVLIVGIVVWVGITNDRKERLDRRLDEAAGFAIPFLPRGLDEIPRSPNDQDAIITVRRGDLVKSNSDVTLPKLDVDYADTYVNGVRYRVRTVEIPGPEPTSLAVGATYDGTIAETNNLHRRVLLICGFAIGAATVFAWLLATFAVRPFKQLAQQTRSIDAGRRGATGGGARRHGGRRDRRGHEGHAAAHLGRAEPDQGGARLGARLRRRVLPRAAHSADRDAHQPRGAVHPGSARRPAQRGAQRRHPHPVADRGHPDAPWSGWPRANCRRRTITCRSTSPTCSTAPRTTPARIYPDLDVSLVPSPTCIIVGLPAGLRLAVDNAIANAVKHGGATRVQLSAVSSRAGVEIAVDDNGSGVPEAERHVVFERFSRGSTASHSGSGLGLALVAQQAQLHGGTASLEDSPLGGARLVLRLPGPS